MSFHITTSDVSVFNARLHRLTAGDILRVLHKDSAFPDAVVLGFNENGDVKVSRPYVYASSVGTTGPTPLLGCETFVIEASKLKHYALLGHGRVAT